jgi:hypothetical protein
MDSEIYAELLARVVRITGLEGRPAQAVTLMLMEDWEPPVAAPDIVRMARELGYEVADAPKRTAADAMAEGMREMQLEPDPAKVLHEMYREMPRVLNASIPVIGRAPKSSVFYDGLTDSDEWNAQIAALPEHVRLLIGSIDVYYEKLTIRLYDEANDLDREVGPIDISRYADGEQLGKAIEVLLARLPRVLSSDFN